MTLTPEAFFSLMLIKHFLADFTQLQTPSMYLNKGKLTHWGGYAHAGMHLCLSLVVLAFFGLRFSHDIFFKVLAFEFVVHYAMDYIKVNVGDKKGYYEYVLPQQNTPGGEGYLKIKHPNYFLWFGIDQLVHGLTYVAMWGWILHWVRETVSV